LFEGCLVGIAVTLAVAVVRAWLDPILGSAAAFRIFYIAVIVTAWYYGFWPALFTLVLGYCLASYLFDDTRGDLGVYQFRNQVSCALYFIIGICLARVVAWLKQDIERRQRGERDLRKSQEELQMHQLELAHMARLGVMGEMVAALAHELNQPLHAAKNYASGSIRRLLKNPQDDGQVMMALEQIGREVDRASEILRRVRDFVKKSGLNVLAIPVNGVVKEAVMIVNVEIKRTCGRVVCELAPGLAPVKADPIQIEQVVVNLVRNGLEAMHERTAEECVVTIGTRRCDERTIDVFVRDRGQGIDEQEMSKVFEPFFTTKPEGMGMGLAICRSIVRAHEGRLWVTANDDCGCTFHFTLPVAQES
jgi:C4-dicarboxylate-specific signal transduction histidine kinase